MITRQKLKKTQGGMELIRRIAAEGDRVFSTERARELASEVGLKESYLLEALCAEVNGTHFRYPAYITSRPESRMLANYLELATEVVLEPTSPFKGNALSIDSRPSDAIAIALRTKAPIFVSDDVLKKSKQIEETEEGVPGDKSEQGKRWKDILEKLKPEDFGKYKT